MTEKFKPPSPKLFQAIQMGLTADEAYFPIEQDELSLLRGRESELLVKRIINKSSLVEKVRINPRFGSLDIAGKDLTVRLKKIEKTDSQKVYVQVKSSDTGIRTWQRDIKERLNIGNYGLSQFLLSQKLLVLNASIDHNAILDQFESGVLRINEYLSSKFHEKRYF